MNKYIWLKRTVLFILALMIMFILAAFRKENNYDKEYYKLNLERGQKQQCLIDLGRQGNLKYLLQPNIYTVYLRLQLPDDAANIHCESEGITMLLSQSSKKGYWQELEHKQPLQRFREALPVSAELYFPKEEIKQYRVKQGKIKFYDNNGLYAQVELNVINSKYSKEE